MKYITISDVISAICAINDVQDSSISNVNDIDFNKNQASNMSEVHNISTVNENNTSTVSKSNEENNKNITDVISEIAKDNTKQIPNKLPINNNEGKETINTSNVKPSLECNRILRRDNRAPKKPLNAFLLYFQYRTKDITQYEIKHWYRIAEEWEKLKPEDKSIWRVKAGREKFNHAMKVDSFNRVIGYKKYCYGKNTKIEPNLIVYSANLYGTCELNPNFLPFKVIPH